MADVDEPMYEVPLSRLRELSQPRRKDAAVSPDEWARVLMAGARKASRTPTSDGLPETFRRVLHEMGQEMVRIAEERRAEDDRQRGMGEGQGPGHTP